MKKLINTVKQVSEVDVPILLTGESGVGKGEIANLIISHSHRENKPFVKINCGAIPESLIESELFGYEPGAFTGASKKGKIGFFEQADNGTIFLDEIGELPHNLQVKLLNVLQDQEIVRVGAEKPKSIDVRVIAATNKDLEDMVENGDFREDLFYRLNVVPLYIPPLRNRLADIPLLINHYTEKFSEKYKKQLVFTESAVEALLNYEWPGNVRELVNIIERAFVIINKTKIEHEDITYLKMGVEKRRSGSFTINKIVPLKSAVEEVEKELILKAVKNVKSYRKAANLLGVNVSTISRKMNKYKNKH